MEFNHISVLLDQSIDSLNIKKNCIYVDGTMGGAGHSLEIAKKLGENGKLICIDQDENAHEKSKDVLKDYLDKIIFVHDNFSNIKEILANINVEKIDGMLLDLGVSSHQLDEAERGFSYMQDAPLDMRMDSRNSLTAYKIVNEYSEKDLNNVIFEYGEERWAKRIAEFIVSQRKIEPINTTFDLVRVIKKAIPKGARLDGPHPAKRTFQAIRIEVNNELGILEKTIYDIGNCLNIGGRISIITFHSLEDRIVKNAFRTMENPCTCPREFPMCVCGKTPIVKLITRKPILPTDQEIIDNNRSRSSKLRVCERV